MLIGKNHLRPAAVVIVLPVLPSDIMEDAGTFEQEAVMAAQVVQGLEAVKELEGKAGHRAAVRQDFLTGRGKEFNGPAGGILLCGR
jgi:hypothetical protein